MDKVIRRGSARTFFCGYFNWSEKVSEALGKKYVFNENTGETGWKPQVVSDGYGIWCPDLDGRPEIIKDYRYWCGAYYESYVESLLDSGQAQEKKSYLYNETGHWVIDADSACCLKYCSHDKSCNLLDTSSSTSREYRFTVKRLHLFRFAFGKCIFAIEIHASDVNLDDLTFFHYAMRDVSMLKGAKYDGWNEYLHALEPLKDMSPDGEYTGWVDTGAKLKAFQIVGSDYIGDDLLYELGTMSAIGSLKDGGYFSPSEAYYNSIMTVNKVSVFRNWSALALLDTFTVVGKGLDRDFVWAASYFRMIYVHVLYQKDLLFDINRRFRNPDAVLDARGLVKEVKDIERYYAFPAISYNFLPQLIYEKIKEGLDVDKEREQIHKYIEQETSRQEAEREKASAEAEKKLSMALTGLTILTLGSVLYDVTSLVSEFIGVGTVCCQRWVSAGVFVVIFIVVYFLFRKYIDEWFRGIWKK